MTTDGNELTTVRVVNKRDTGSRDYHFPSLTPCTHGVYQKEIETDF